MILILCLILQEPISLPDVDVIPYEEERCEYKTRYQI